MVCRTRRPDIVGHRVRQTIDRNIHRLLEPDHDDRARGGHFGGNILGELEHQPGVTIGGGECGLALDGIRPAGAGKRQTDQDEPGRKP